jgi:hypothetical protein
MLYVIQILFKFFYSNFYFKSSSKQQDDHKSERLTSSQTDKAVINIPTAAETITKSGFLFV